MALEKIVFLPFSYLIDLWRWDVFRGNVDNLNDRWSQLRLQYQGLCPPVRCSETDFDPGAKNHVPDNTPLIRHFFKLLCREAGHLGPLHTYGSHAAGDKLAGLLRLGISIPWHDALARMTCGSGKLDARPLLNTSPRSGGTYGTAWAIPPSAGSPATTTSAPRQPSDRTPATIRPRGLSTRISSKSIN
ncbi:ACE, partial [Cordylochernes scorpioides]